uniref:Ig-like domain-containing protein n=1 Tax=Scylla olivacea TaxID=85551 RepID=A0A0P4WGF9_SCYOL
MSIRLLGVDGPVSAGVGVTLVCMVVGARPEPTVTWWLDGRPLTARDERMLQNNVTESHLVLVATPEDQGRYLSCRAETPGLLQSSLEDGMKLVVHCEYWYSIPWNFLPISAFSPSYDFNSFKREVSRHFSFNFR